MEGLPLFFTDVIFERALKKIANFFLSNATHAHKIKQKKKIKISKIISPWSSERSWQSETSKNQNKVWVETFRRKNFSLNYCQLVSICHSVSVWRELLRNGHKIRASDHRVLPADLQHVHAEKWAIAGGRGILDRRSTARQNRGSGGVHDKILHKRRNVSKGD